MRSGGWLGVSRESRPQPVPSWPTVIATTFRLWLQRHMILARPNPPQLPGNSRRPRVTVLVVATVLTVVVLGVVVVLSVVRTGHAVAARQVTTRQARAAVDPPPVKSAPASPPAAGLATLAAAGASRQQAAAWVAAQVSRGTIVACDPLMCTELDQRGFPAADLSLVSTSSGDLLGSGIVVSTAAVRSQLGSRLATVYAPVIIASFGTGADLVQVRVTAVGSAAAYLSAVRADVRARKLAGTELTGNRNISMPAGARAALTAGRVDSRLLITLGALAHRFSVRIVSISDAGPDAAATVPLRQLTVAAPATAYLGRLLAFLRAQRPPLLPLVSLRHHDRTTEVQIKFPAPSPTGLLSAGASP
jgi:hypothetical protein